MVAIIGRSGWGALPPNRECGDAAKCDAIVLHHSVTAQPRTIDEAIYLTQQIDKQHLSEVGASGRPTYCDLAYNLLVGPDCVLIGRGPYVNDGATDNDTSTYTVSVCILGDYRTDLVDDAFLRSLRDAVSICRGVWGPIPVRAHHDYYATTCPGPNVDAIIATLNREDQMTLTEFFNHPITLSDGDPPAPYPTTIEGWFIYMHREVQILRQAVQRLEAKP